MSRKPSRSCGLEVFHATPGFSMVELLVVVAIVITVTAISVPIVSKLLTSAQLRGGMGDLFRGVRDLFGGKFDVLGGRGHYSRSRRLLDLGFLLP